MKTLLLSAFSLLSLMVDPLVSVFRAAMRLATPRQSSLPRLIAFAQHPFQRRSYGKTVAGGAGIMRFFGLAFSPRVLAVAIVVLMVVGVAHVHTGPPDVSMIAMSFAGTLVEKRQEFAAKQRELAEVMDLARDGKVFDLSRKSVLEKLGATDAADALLKVKARNAELETLGNDLQQAELKEIHGSIGEREDLINTPYRGEHPTGSGMEAKTLGQMFIESKQYREGYRKNGQVGSPAVLDMSIKTLMTTSAGFAPESVRSGLVVPAVNFSLAEILDLVPVFPIGQASFKYMEETTRTHSGAETAEGVAYPESAFAYTEKSSDVRKIADSLPVTDEQLEDEGQVASLIDQRLRYGVRRRLASQILNGNGTAPNLRGVLNVVGIQTQAKGADSIMAAAYKAITKVRFTGQAEPNAFVFHPNDWQEIVLAQESTGNFLWGHPSMGPVTSLWGLKVALSTGIAENTALVGDWSNFSRLDEKRGVEVAVGYVNTQFTEGEKTLRADLRAAFTVTRPAAFCSITGV